MTPTTSQTLRRRVRRLRALADDLERSPVLRLGDGRRTSQGIHADQERLHGDADRLRWQAYLFEQGAHQLVAIETHRGQAMNRWRIG